jgi:hypothetical protein
MTKIIWIIFLLLSVKGNSQPAFFYKEFGDSSLINFGKGVTQLPSGSIFYLGYTLGTPTEISFTKLDENGNELFTSYFSYQNLSATAERMVFNSQDAFVICGAGANAAGNVQPLLMKVDTSGNLIWQYVYGNDSMNSSFSGIAKSAGGYIASGYQPDPQTLISSILVTSIDENGFEKWSSYYGDPMETEVSDACIVLSDGSLVFSGDKSVSQGIYNQYVVKTDSTGNFLWDLVISSNNNGGCKNLFIDSNNDLIIVGEAATDSSPDFDILLTKINMNSASITWSKYIRSSNESDAGFSILEDSDHNYLITGYGYDTSQATKRIVFIKTDNQGNELSKKYFGTSSINIGFDLQKSVYNGYLIAGTDYGNHRRVLIYDEPAATVIDESFEKLQFNLYPNPVINGNIIYWNKKARSVFVSDLSGRIIIEHLDDSTSLTSLNVSALNNGFYFITVNDGNNFSGQRFVICK